MKVDDVVYFRKDEGSAIKDEWTVGVVDAVKFGRDGLIREATVKYCNPSEDFHRRTTRSVRSLVRLFNVMDSHWRNDMEQVRKLLKVMDIDSVVEGSEDATPKVNVAEDRDPTLRKCCCQSHCSLSLHVSRGVALVKQSKFEKPEVDVNIMVKQIGWDYKVDGLTDFIGEETSLADAEDNFPKDSIMGLMTAVNMDFT